MAETRRESQTTTADSSVPQAQQKEEDGGEPQVEMTNPVAAAGANAEGKEKKKKEAKLCNGLHCVWQMLYFVCTLPALVGALLFAFTGNLWWEQIAFLMHSPCFASALLFIMSSPASSGMDTPAAVVGYGNFLIFWGVQIVGSIGDENSEVLGYLAILSINIAFVYFVLQSRKKIGASLSAKRLDEYLTNTVFVYGGTQIASMVYLSSHTMKCLGKNPDLTTRDEVSDACGASIWPSICISLMIFMVMIFKLCMVPLSSSAAETSISDLCNIEDLSLKLKIQMLSICTVFFSNIVLFGLQEEGPEPEWMYYLSGVVGLNIMFVLLVEFIFMFVSRLRQRRQSLAVPIEQAEGPAAGKEQLRSKNSSDVLEKMTGNLI